MTQAKTVLFEKLKKDKLRDAAKHKRMQYLMQVLANLNELFDYPLDSYNHIVKCLEIVEKHFVPSKKTTMALYDFKHFFFHGKSNIYFLHQFRDHVVLIHSNGAYAIYRSKTQIT